METGVLVTFGAYLLAMLAIGLWFVRRTHTPDDYLLGGRRLNRWVTALSAQASDMSGWLLMGLPGAVFLSGLGELWMVGGLAVGTALNWLFVAPRLRARTEQVGAITLPDFFARRFGGDRGATLGLAAAAATFFFFGIYVGAGLMGAGLLFESVLGVSYPAAVATGAAVVVGYTLLGGFLAVSWTDLVQGLMILAALLVVPVAAFLGHVTPHAPPVGTLLQVPGTGTPTVGALAAFSAASWGLGYLGQPHILVRFMAAKSTRELRPAAAIALVWVVLCLGGAVAVGVAGARVYPQGLENAERVFIRLVRDLFDPWSGGILLAAILAAIMSTIDSQLLVAASAVSEDLYARRLRPTSSARTRVWVGRATVAALTALAVALALDRNETVLGLVAYAWAGLGASFGPLVLASLFWPRTTYAGAVTGLIAGACTTVLWKEAGLGARLYEIVPGFAAGALALIVVSRLGPRRTRADSESDATPTPS